MLEEVLWPVVANILCYGLFSLLGFCVLWHSWNISDLDSTTCDSKLMAREGGIDPTDSEPQWKVLFCFCHGWKMHAEKSALYPGGLEYKNFDLFISIRPPNSW